MYLLPKIVIVELRSIIVVVVLSSHEILALVEVDGIVLVAIGGSGVPEGRSLVVEGCVKVSVVLLTPSVKGSLLKIHFEVLFVKSFNAL